MKKSTREWVAKAEEDFDVVVFLARRRKKPLWAPLCFHAQQCAEKYLKARLNEASNQFGKTNDLEQLLNQALAVEPLWSSYQSALKRLSQLAVTPRYPGRVFTKAEAQSALKDCRSFRREARLSLGLRA